MEKKSANFFEIAYVPAGSNEIKRKRLEGRVLTCLVSGPFEATKIQTGFGFLTSFSNIGPCNEFLNQRLNPSINTPIIPNRIPLRRGKSIRRLEPDFDEVVEKGFDFESSLKHIPELDDEPSTTQECEDEDGLKYLINVVNKKVLKDDDDKSVEFVKEVKNDENC